MCMCMCARIHVRLLGTSVSTVVYLYVVMRACLCCVRKDSEGELYVHRCQRVLMKATQRVVGEIESNAKLVAGGVRFAQK